MFNLKDAIEDAYSEEIENGTELYVLPDSSLGLKNVWEDRFNVGTSMERIVSGWYIAHFQGRWWCWDRRTIGSSNNEQNMLRACEIHPGKLKK